MKIMGKPLRKSYKLNFTGKFVVIFFKALLLKVKNFKGPLFASASPPSSICEQSLIWFKYYALFTTQLLKALHLEIFYTAL